MTPIENFARALAVVVMLALASLVVIGEARIGAGKPFIEDAYYPLSVSRNLALGNGMSADGVSLTNGVQPLFTVLSAASFLVSGGDRTLGLRLQFALHAAIMAVAAALAASIAVRLAGTTLRTAWGWPALLYVSAIFPITIHFNGLETGFQILMLLTVLRIFMSAGTDSLRGCALLGLALGLLVLARIDAVFLVILLSAYALFRHRADIVTTLLRAGAIGGIAFAVSLPWWAYNVLAFGALTPSSGLALQEWTMAPERWVQGAAAVSQTIVPWLYVTWLVDNPHPLRWLLVAAGVAGLAAIWRLSGSSGYRAVGLNDGAESQKFFVFSRILMLHIGILFFWYASSSWAFFFYTRYLAFFSVIPIILLSALALRHGARLGRAIAGIVALGLAAQGTGAAAIYHSGAWLDGNTTFASVRLARAHVPDGEWVGAGQSGTLGFFRDRVLNLDGRVNSAVLHKQDQMLDFLDEQDIRWVVDTGIYLERYLGIDPAANGWCEIAEDGGYRLFRREHGGCR